MVPLPAIAFILTGSAATVSFGLIVTTIVVNLVLSAILGKILEPNLPNSGKAVKGLQTIIKSSIAPRRVIYGETMTGGPYVVVQTKGTTNEILKMVIALAGHPIKDVLGVVFEDQYINIAGLGGALNEATNDLSQFYFVNQGKFGTLDAVDHVKIIKVLGTGFADINYVINENDTEVTQDRERAILVRSNLDDWSLPVVGTRDSITGLYGAGDKLTNIAYIYVELKFNRDVFTGIPKMKFHVKGKVLYNPRLDNTYTSEGADGGSQLISNPDTWQYSSNWALCCLDYLLDTSYGLAAKPEGTAADPGEITWSDVIQAERDSALLVTNGLVQPDTITTPRFTTNGVFEVNSTPISNMEALLTSGAGQLIYAQGEYKLRAGVYRAPENLTDIINEDMIVGPLTIRTHTPRSELFNKAAGVFVDKGYDVTQVPTTENQPIFGATDFAIVDPVDPADGLNPFEVIDGEEIIREFDYPFTTEDFEAQRLARIQLERVRQGLTLSFEANLRILKFSVGDNIYFEVLSDSKYNNQPFFNRLGFDDEVQQQPFSGPVYYKQFKIFSMEYNDKFNIDTILIEESEQIYEWNDGDANLIDHELIAGQIIDDPTGTVIPPTFLAATEVETWPNRSTRITWTSGDRGATVNAIDKAHTASYTLHYGVVTNPSAVGDDRVDDWITAGTTLSDHAVDLQGPISIENIFVDEVTEFEFRLKANTYLGRSSVWVYYSDDIGSYFEPTLPPTGFTSIPVAGQKTLTFDTQITSFDFNVGTDQGEFGLFDSGGNGFAPTNYNQVDKIYFNIRDVDGLDTIPLINQLRFFDVVTFFISSSRWYKYQLVGASINPTFVGTNTISGPALNKTTMVLIQVAMVDYKDSDPTETSLITATNIEFKFERDTENTKLQEIMDLTFDKSIAFNTPGAGFNYWEGVQNLESPSSFTFELQGGEDGSSNAIKWDLIPPTSPSTQSAGTISTAWFNRTPPGDLKISFRYLSITGTSPTLADTTVQISMVGNDKPSLGTGQTSSSRTVYFPPTGAMNWETVTVIIPSLRQKYFQLFFAVGLTQAGATTDFILDSMDIEVLTGPQSFAATISGNVAIVSYEGSQAYTVDMNPATGNVTINIVGSFDASEVGVMRIKTIQDSTARTITWQFNGSTTPMEWPGGSIPAASTGSNDKDIWTWTTLDGGTTFAGSVELNVS